MPILQTVSDPGAATWADNQDLAVGALDTDDAATGNSNDVTIQTGNAAAGNSGDIVMTPGTASGTVGTVQTVGRLTTTDGIASGTVRVVGGRAYSNVADSTAVTNTTAATAFDETYSIPANTLGVGSTVRVRAVVRTTVQAGTTDLTVIGRVGGTNVVVGAAITDPAVNETAVLEFWITTRAAAGAAVDTVGGGYVIDAGNNVLATASTMANAVALATNGALVVDVTAQWAAADASSCFLESLIVEVE